MNSASTKPLAVVTGASNGIGYELATQFAQHGFDLVVAAEDGGIAEAARAFEGLGAGVESLQVDLATYDGVEQLYGRITASGRPVEALALNAGVGVGGDFARGTALKDELTLIALNVVSPVHLAKRVLPDMVAHGQGRVLFTSSIAATMPAPFEAVYGASKAFLLSFAEALRNELKDTGVTVTALMPGPTETNFFHRAGMDDTKVSASEKDDPAEVARQGFEALMAGKDKVIASSLKTKLQGAANELLPETAKAEAHRRLAEPGSAGK
jgi:short-subunit dehydrogenase